MDNVQVKFDPVFLLAGCATRTEVAELGQRLDKVESALQTAQSELKSDRDKFVAETARLQVELRSLQAPQAASATPVPTPEATATPVAPEVIEVKSGWVSNGQVSLKVDRVATYRQWSGLGQLERVDKDAQEQLERLALRVDRGELKVIVVNLHLRNDTKEKKELGYQVNSVATDPRANLHIRGEEGSEFRSLKTWSPTSESYKNDAASQLTHHLPGTFPMNSMAAPKSSVSGALAFVVPGWFKPSVIFTKANGGGYSGGDTNVWFGERELMVKLP